MANESMKTLREKAEELVRGGIGNRAQLLAAVPALVRLQSAVKMAKARLAETKKVEEELCRVCSEYAHAHPDHVFGESFSVSPIGVESGDVTIDERCYHFSYGFDGYVRSDAAQTLSQDFLAGLPAGWTKSRLELDKTAVNRLKPSEEELASVGLERKVKSGWGEM